MKRSRLVKRTRLAVLAVALSLAAVPVTAAAVGSVTTTPPVTVTASETASVAAAASPAKLQPAVSAAGAASAIRSALWEWPVDGTRVLLRPYIAPPTPYGPGHRGIDIALSAGGTVYAPADGIVHFSGIVVDRPVLSIRHADGLISSFEPVSSKLVAGDHVRSGDQIGEAEAGHCTVACVHFGVRLYGDYVSPLNYLGGIPHSVLLPTRPLR